MLKKINPGDPTPAPVQVNKGKRGYTCWIFKCKEKRDNGNEYYRYKIAHKMNKRFISKEDALDFGYSRIYGEKCPQFFIPMRIKPVPALSTN